MKTKVGLVSLGCPKNLVDSELMLGLLDSDNFEVTGEEAQADVIIVNTCGFIETAKQESINTILEMAQYKKGKCKSLIVTGCMAERYRQEILDAMPEVDAVIGPGNYSGLVQAVIESMEGKKPLLFGKLGEIGYLEGKRVLSHKKGYAYLKIAEGCDNRCTYCVIPLLRGRYRSRKMEDVAAEAFRLAGEGVKELILVAQDTTRYGTDIYGSKKLVELIKRLSSISGIEWIRLLYCYPEEIDDCLIEEIAQNPKVCKYLDIPIQHISDSVLKAMGRRGDSGDIRLLLDKLRSKVPEIVIRTSLIVGFPGEGESDFALLYDFVEKYKFDRLGVFKYSREEGTPAAKAVKQVPAKIKQKRYDRLMSLQNTIVDGINRERLGKCYRAIVEGVAEDGIFYYGRTYGEAPEIDGNVFFTSSGPLEVGSMVNIKILDNDEYDLIGEATDEFTQ